MDNLGTEAVKSLHQTIEAAGAGLLYLPACSPECLPMEFKCPGLVCRLQIFFYSDGPTAVGARPISQANAS